MYINIYYENLFLRKKSSPTRAALDLASMEKGEEIPDNTTPKSFPTFFVKNYYYDPQYKFGDKNVKVRKT